MRALAEIFAGFHSQCPAVPCRTRWKNKAQMKPSSGRKCHLVCSWLTVRATRATWCHIVPHRATCAISCYMTCPVTSSLPTEATEAMHLCRLCLCSPAKSEAVQLQKDHHEFAKEHRARRNQASPLNMT